MNQNDSSESSYRDLDKFSFNDVAESINEKCWKLSCYILSQYDIIELSHPWNEYWCIFANRFNDLFKRTFFKEFIELTALIRSLLERNDIKVEIKKIGDVYVGVVGILTTNNSGKDLTLREACNKTIHAKNHDISFDWSDKHPLFNGKNGYEDYEDSENIKFKDPIIITEGTYKNSDWISKIHFFKYINEALSLVDY